MSIDWETDVDASNESSHHIANMNRLAVVTLGQVEGWSWNDLLPTEAHVCGEDANRCDIEETPTEGLEDFELEAVDVSDISGIFEFAIRFPEEIDGGRWIEDGLQVQVDQIWWRANSIRMSYSKTILEQVHCHERKQSDA